MVTRPSPFDDYTRSRILALMAIESRQCPRCKNYDSIVPLTDSTNDKHWTENKGQRFGVRQFRCVACGLSDLVERDAARATRGQPDPLPGEPAFSDGRMYIAQPVDQSPDEPGVT